jgi:2-dehydro-3-deoxyphosphogluconate aldolase / (4S)-4-hydroxy-2-oxoglutarate aldolase
MNIDDIMALAPVIPVLVIDDANQAKPIAEALVGGGLSALEVTLRTPAALKVIEEMSRVPGAVVGAGTVVAAHQVRAARDAGARFIVSPGLTDRVIEAAQSENLPILPGVSTASDLMRGLEFGLDSFKFFPAEASGGLRALKALAAPFFQCTFCPTGGITESTAVEWLAIPQVACVGGSWVVPSGELDVDTIRARAIAASLLQSTNMAKRGRKSDGQY